MESIFLAVVSGGPRSNPMCYFFMWSYVFFYIVSCVRMCLHGRSEAHIFLSGYSPPASEELLSLFSQLLYLETTSGDLRALWSEPGGSLELQLCQ